MKNKIKSLGIIILAVAAVLAMTSCGELFVGFGAPTGVVATALSDGSVHVTWDAVNGAAGYIIDYRIQLDSTSTRRSAGTSQITAYTHSYHGINSGTTVYYYVKAYKGSYYSSDRVDSAYASPVSVIITRN